MLGTTCCSQLICTILITPPLLLDFYKIVKMPLVCLTNCHSTPLPFHVFTQNPPFLSSFSFSFNFCYSFSISTLPIFFSYILLYPLSPLFVYSTLPPFIWNHTLPLHILFSISLYPSLYYFDIFNSYPSSPQNIGYPSPFTIFFIPLPPNFTDTPNSS